jgi:hypothetical protein
MTATTTDDSEKLKNTPAMLIPLKRKRDGDIQGPEIYAIFINQFIDILAKSLQDETIRQYHSFFHVNKAARSAFLNSSSLAAKREQFQFAKCLEGLIPDCQITVHCPETQTSYIFRFELPDGIILHFRSKYCKMIVPEDIAAVFNAMMVASSPCKDDPLCPINDFQHIWRAVSRKVREWPDDFILHERHMSGHANVYENDESDHIFTRMGYTDLADPTPVIPSIARLVDGALTRVENWRKLEKVRSLTRLLEIEVEREAEREAAGKTMDENADSQEDEVSIQGQKSKYVKLKQPENLRRNVRILGKN